MNEEDLARKKKNYFIVCGVIAGVILGLKVYSEYRLSKI